MSAFIRFLSRRGTRRGNKSGQPSEPEKPKNVIVCKVQLLDGSSLSVDLNVMHKTFPQMTSIFVLMIFFIAEKGTWQRTVRQSILPFRYHRDGLFWTRIYRCKQYTSK